MESFILWGIGILVYLLIGRGFMLSFKGIKEKEMESLDPSNIDLICCVLLWPIDFGYLISQASAYYQDEKNRLYGLLGPKLPFKHALMMEVFAMKYKLHDIEETLHNIENSLQKDNDKKDA